VIPWITYFDAITEALQVEMRLDSTVLCLVPRSADATQRPTDELVGEFGASRVSEHDGGPSILAAASAAASEGMRPVCELELSALGEGEADQLAETVSSGALVIRLVCDGEVGSGLPGLHGWLARCPELRAVSPATAADAKGLLISAIRDPDPVCFVESRALYTSVCDAVPEGNHTVALGDARLIRQGTEIVVLAHGAAAIAAEQAARDMNDEVGIVDLRTLRPLDRDAVVATVRDAGKVLIAEHPNVSTGFAAGLVELIYDEVPDHLDAPIRELGTSTAPAGSNGDWMQSMKEPAVSSSPSDGAPFVQDGSPVLTDAVELTVPDLGRSVESATIVAWTKEVGELVAADEPICRLAVDELQFEVCSTAHGELTHLYAAAGDSVRAGDSIAEVAPAVGEAPAEPFYESAPPASPAPEPVVELAAEPTVEKPDRPGPWPRAGEDVDWAKWHSPVVRKLADQDDIDLSEVEGTGIGGRVRKRDVLSHTADGA